MNLLASRKKLLIAESELNRAQLLQDWQTMAGEVNALANQAKTITAFASAAATLIAGLASFRRKKPEPAPKRYSWLQTILKGAQLAGSFWSQFRSSGSDREKE
jgi:hypothetical protein